MPEELKGAAAQPPADGDAAVKSAEVSQEQAAPQDQYTALETRLQRLETLEKENHSLRTTLGRRDSELRVRKAGPAFEQAFNQYERKVKPYLLEHGYSEERLQDWIEKHTESLYETYERLSEMTPATTPARDPADEIKALRAELEAVKTAGKPAPVNPARTNGGAPSGSAPTVNEENIDALHLTGKVSDERYKTFLRTGRL